MERRWLKIRAGVAVAVTTIVGFFVLLSSLYGFTIVDLTGDISCEGTYENPCISEFEVRNPNAYVVDVYSKDQVKLDFSPDIKDYALFVPDGRCSATGKCACDLEDGSRLGFEDWRCVDFTNKTKPRKDKVYNFRFPRYSTTHFLLAGIKNNPSDEIKWTFGTNEEELDPVWLSASEIRYTPNTKTICRNGRCVQTIYGDIRYVFEDKMWKDISEARSLKSSGIKVNIEEDPRWKVQVIDFNYSSIKLNLTSTEIGNIPIRIKTEEQKSETNDSKIKFYLTESFKQKEDSIVKTYNFSLSDTLIFGLNSTNVTYDTGTDTTDFTVVGGVTFLTVKAWGAGGAENGAGGGFSIANLSVIPGEDLSVRVGGAGIDGDFSSDGGSGGGYSGIFRSSTPLIIAGGGAGGGGDFGSSGGTGGVGGGITGGTGTQGASGGGTGGGGGNQTAGGAGPGNAVDGSSLQGGAGADNGGGSGSAAAG